MVTWQHPGRETGAFQICNLVSRSHWTQGQLITTLVLDDALLLPNQVSQILKQSSSLPTGLHQLGALSLQGKLRSP